MEDELIKYLKDKLVSTCLYLDKVQSDKKDYNAGLNREIKDTKKRVTVFSKAIESGSTLPILDEYGPEYVDELESYIRKKSPLGIVNVTD